MIYLANLIRIMLSFNVFIKKIEEKPFYRVLFCLCNISFGIDFTMQFP
ncbi:hypothetical protein FLB_01320 [Flavobacterium succinicans]|uniref:Uncharacterized protein n=1 Tax=Flavobacterium succinicans TaxID=29536 RepID=A0A199XUJ5_9FLAO|nr:hypothetical protein FLB_01320 [Flavobacterium succinicans]